MEDLAKDRSPYCVIDLGGGSTEFIVGTAEGEILGSHSARMGCVRLTERMMPSDPPTETEIEIASDYVAERMAEVEKMSLSGKPLLSLGVLALSPLCLLWLRGWSAMMPSLFTVRASF